MTILRHRYRCVACGAVVIVVPREDARRGLRQRPVEKAEELVWAVDAHEPWGVSAPVVEAVAIIRKIIAQDIERDANRQVRLRREVAEDRLISVRDPEMRRGHKSVSEAFEGYKFHHTVELQQGFIVATEVTSANTHDSEPNAAMAERAECASGRVVAKVIGDCASGAEKNRVAHDEVGRARLAHLPRTAQGVVFSKERFAIHLQNKTVTCPLGVTTASLEIVRARTAGPGREVLRPNERARLFAFREHPGASVPAHSQDSRRGSEARRTQSLKAHGAPTLTRTPPAPSRRHRRQRLRRAAYPMMVHSSSQPSPCELTKTTSK